MATLPALGASSDFIIASGYSAGSYTSAQLITAWPEVFRCGGLLNGGMTNTQMARKAEYSAASDAAAYEANYQQTVAYIDGYVTAGNLPNQAALANNAIYIYGGDQDPIVFPVTTAEQNRYFESKGAKVSFNVGEGVGHIFGATAP